MAALEELVSKLELAFSGTLVSVVLYGSAAAPGQSDRFSDLNILCVLKDITPARARKRGAHHEVVASAEQPRPAFDE